MFARQAEERGAQVHIPERHAFAREIWEKNQRRRMTRLRKRTRDATGDFFRLIGADQLAKPCKHVRAVLPRPADLIEVVAPFDIDQAFGLERLRREQAERLGGTRDVVGTAGRQRADTKHGGPRVVRRHHDRLSGERVERLAERAAHVPDHTAGRQQVRHHVFRKTEAREQRRAACRARCRRGKARRCDRIARDPAGQLCGDEVFRVDQRARVDDRLRRKFTEPFQPCRRMIGVKIRSLGTGFGIDRRAYRDLQCAHIARRDCADEWIGSGIENDGRAGYTGDRDCGGRDECGFVFTSQRRGGFAKDRPPVERQDQATGAGRWRGQGGLRDDLAFARHERGRHRRAAEFGGKNRGRGRGHLRISMPCDLPPSG